MGNFLFPESTNIFDNSGARGCERKHGTLLFFFCICLPFVGGSTVASGVLNILAADIRGHSFLLLHARVLQHLCPRSTREENSRHTWRRETQPPSSFAFHAPPAWRDKGTIPTQQHHNKKDKTWQHTHIPRQTNHSQSRTMKNQATRPECSSRCTVTAGSEHGHERARRRATSTSRHERFGRPGPDVPLASAGSGLGQGPTEPHWKQHFLTEFWWWGGGVLLSGLGYGASPY